MQIKACELITSGELREQVGFYLASGNFDEDTPRLMVVVNGSLSCCHLPSLLSCKHSYLTSWMSMMSFRSLQIGGSKCPLYILVSSPSLFFSYFNLQMNHWISPRGFNLPWPPCYAWRHLLAGIQWLEKPLFLDLHEIDFRWWGFDCQMI